MDIAEELNTASRDGAITDLLGLDRIWITQSGRAILLDFPCPGLIEPVPHPRPATVQAFLSDVANAALKNKQTQLPEHAQQFMTSLRQQSFEATQIVVGNLRSLASKTAAISRRRRFASLVFWPALLTAFALLAAVGLTFEQKRWDRDWAKAYPDLPSLRQSLEAATFEWSDVELLKPFDIHLAGHYRRVLLDSNFWNQPQVESLFQSEARDRARNAAQTYPNVSPGELAEADRKVAPALKQLRQFERLQILWFTVAFAWSFLVVLAVIDLLAMLLLSKTPVLRPFGILVSTVGGTAPGRLRLTWRGLVAWLPVFAGAPIIAALAMSNSKDYASTGDALVVLLLGISLFWLVGASLALLSPTRGIPDRLAGTRLLPR